MKPICTVGAVQARPALFTRQRKNSASSIEQGTLSVGNGYLQAVQID